MTEEGDLCPVCQKGHVAYVRDGDCSCHINPPCGACENSKLTCPVCGWQKDEPELREGIHFFTNGVVLDIQRKRVSHTFDHGGRVFDWRYDARSGSTMVYRGRYEGPVTGNDIVALLGDGTFGHRGPSMRDGKFTYTKITD